jgi:hypothetical protein
VEVVRERQDKTGQMVFVFVFVMSRDPGSQNQPVQKPCCGAQPLVLALYRTMHGSSICGTVVRPTEYNITPSEAVSHDPNQTNVRGLTSARITNAKATDSLGERVRLESGDQIVSSHPKRQLRSTHVGPDMQTHAISSRTLTHSYGWSGRNIYEGTSQSLNQMW